MPESRFELAKVLRKLGETDAAQQQLASTRKLVKESQTTPSRRKVHAGRGSGAGGRQAKGRRALPGGDRGSA
jgi:hypothetical protein